MQALGENVIEDINTSNGVNHALLSKQCSSSKLMNSKKAAQPTVPGACPEVNFSFADSVNSQETGRFALEGNFDSMHFSEKEGIEQEQRDRHSDIEEGIGLESMETMQSSMTSNHHRMNQSQSPSKDDELRTDMYESLTNGDCFAKPKFDYSQYEKE